MDSRALFHLFYEHLRRRSLRIFQFAGTRSTRMPVDVGEAAEALNSMFGQKDKEAKDQVGWPYREESFDFTGKDYKVVHKRKMKRTNAGASKPWGW